MLWSEEPTRGKPLEWIMYYDAGRPSKKKNKKKCWRRLTLPLRNAAVPSARISLTSLFGMGRGVPLSQLSPANFI